MEWFLKSSINKELNKGNIVIANQPGFMENRPFKLAWYHFCGIKNLADEMMFCRALTGYKVLMKSCKNHVLIEQCRRKKGKFRALWLTE